MGGPVQGDGKITLPPGAKHKQSRRQLHVQTRLCVWTCATAYMHMFYPWPPDSPRRCDVFFYVKLLKAFKSGNLFIVSPQTMEFRVLIPAL